MKTILNVEGMNCAHCSAAVKAAVSTLDGVSEAVVDLVAKTATVEHSEGVSVDMMKEAIEEQGYDVVGAKSA